MRIPSVLIAACALACATETFAQPSISWYTMDGGGGTSRGGSFTLSGTVGQPDASGALVGGTFTVRGGFWAAVSNDACNPADICGTGATYTAGSVDIGPDGALTIEDFLNFLSAFADGTGCSGTAPCNPADICGIGATYSAGTVDIGPDGELTIEDFLNFLSAFGDGTGCN